MDFSTVDKAIKKGDVIRLRKYLETSVDANLCDLNGYTLLMSAALKGDTTVGTELIDRGAQIDLRNKHGWTALSLAAHTGHPGFVGLLCRSGASLDGHPFGSSFEDFLDWASQYGTGSKEAMAKTRQIIKSTRETRCIVPE